MNKMKLNRSFFNYSTVIITILIIFSRRLSTGDCEQSDNNVQQASHLDHQEDNKKEAFQDLPTLWLCVLGSTIFCKAVSYFILYFAKVENTDALKLHLHVFVAFASGSLLANSFLRLIPHSNYCDNGQETTSGFWVVCGICSFFAVEKCIRVLRGGQGHSHGPAMQNDVRENNEFKNEHDSVSKAINENIDTSQHSVRLETPTNTTNKILVKPIEELSHSHGPVMQNDIRENNELKNKNDSDNETINENFDTSQHSVRLETPTNTTNKILVKPIEKLKKFQEKTDLTVSGYLNLLADFTHNLTDGFSIGASYLAGNSIGLITTLTVLLHEIPHEIGDLAILVTSGCTKRKALTLHLVTIIGAAIGAIIFLLSFRILIPWVLPFTAGGFIYIAAVSVLPSLLAESKKFGQAVKEILALMVGVGLIFLVDWTEKGEQV